MTKDLEQKLVECWPTWFDIRGDPRLTRMVDGFAHDDGWFEIVWRLCADLEPIVAEIEKKTWLPFEVRQVKEKMGGLVVYVNYHSDAISERITAAYWESLKTCEVCGQPGRRRGGSRIRTLCAEHLSMH